MHNKSSADTKMGDHLATTDRAKKWGLLCPFPWEQLDPHLTQCCLGRGLPPYHVVSWCIQPFGHNRHGPKVEGAAVRLWEELGPHLTQCGLGWGLPPCQAASWSIQPFGHNRHGPKSVAGAVHFWRELGPHLIQCRPGRAYLRTTRYLDPCSHLAITDMGRKLGGCVPFGGRWLWGPISPQKGGDGSPSNTVWPGPRPTSTPSDTLIHPTVWPQYTSTDRTDRQTDRQWSDRIWWIVLQMVAQKLNLKLNQHSSSRSAHMCVHIIVHNCCTQHSTEQFW